MYVQFRSLSRTLLIAGALAGMALASSSLQAQNDPPPGSARLAHLQGNVSFQLDGSDSWGEADNNMPVGSGDRVYTDQGRGELQAGQVRAYFGPGADLTLVDLNDQGIQLGLAQGSANIFSDGFAQDQTFSVQTPNGAITVDGRAGFRIDVYPEEQSTVITNSRNFGGILLNGAGGYQFTLRPGESVQLTGTNPVYTQPLEPAAPDTLARWSTDFEVARQNSISARYVSAEMAGYDELDNNGDWQPESDYGPIWFPRVEAGWAPYHNGHWVNRPFYGWTWVADESWGAAPFHYGRWTQVRGRWGWIPGPREQHPVWSPAQVVFAGGVHVGGVGVSVWFPLGPGEAYRPWYPCTPQYVNRVNVTNIRESRVVHVQNTYVNVVNVTNVTYVNRTVGVTAMRHEDFAAGHSAKAVAVKVDPRAVEHVQAARPEVPPPARPVIQRPVAKPVAVQAARPVLINHQGQQAAAAPNAKPVVVPVKAAPPAPKPIPGRAAIGTPTIAGKPAPVAPASPVRPGSPAQPASSVQPAHPVGSANPVSPVAPKVTPVPNPPAAGRPTPTTPVAPLTPKVAPQPVNPVAPVNPAPARPQPLAPVERPAAPVRGPVNAPPAAGRPAPAAPVVPSNPRATPQRPVPVRPLTPAPPAAAPAERPLPAHPPTATPTPRQAPETVAPPAPRTPAPRTPAPPATRPQPATPEVKPARPAQERPAPPVRDSKKNDKKDDKRTPPKKPE